MSRYSLCPSLPQPLVEQLDGCLLLSASPAVSIGDVALAEGDGGQAAFVFTVSLSKASAKQVSVRFATADGTAKAAEGDYAATAGTLTFAPGETTKTITVLVNGDAAYEGDETFVVKLTSARNAAIADRTGAATIFNDDPPPWATTPPPVEASPDNRDDF